jgi:FAD/FMN-containing dehydrogenase
LGIISSLNLRLRPRSLARRTVIARGSLERASTVCAALPLAYGVLATPGSIEIRLEGWPEDVEAQSRLVATLLEDAHSEDDVQFPSQWPWLDEAVTVEAAVTPSSLIELTNAISAPWGALAGVGIVWAGLPSAGVPLEELRAQVAALGGIAPVIKGSGGLGPGGPKPGSEAWAIQRRIKVAFDPRGVLAPGRFWGEA